MLDVKGILFIGFGGHARSLADVALDNGVPAICFFDESAQPDECFLEFPVTNQLPEQLSAGWAAFPASGDHNIRQQQLRLIQQRAWTMPCLVASTATIGVGAVLGDGVFIGHHAHVGPYARVAQGAIVNTSALLEHESSLGELSHIAVNATVAGRCTIGAHVFVGAGAMVIDRISVCDYVTVGAGAVVCDAIVDSGIYVGVPAKRIQSN